MEDKQIYTILKKFFKKVAYKVFKNPVEPPFAIYYRDGLQTTGADNINYYNYNTYTIEIYTDTPDRDLEEKLENELINNEIFYKKSGDIYISDEKMYVVYFYI